MKFKPTDRDWSDLEGENPSPKRIARYQKVLRAILDGLEVILKEHQNGYAINAQIIDWVFATGVQGDSRTYQPVVALTYNKEPTYAHIRRISTAITNALPVGRVIVSLTHRVVPTKTAQLIVPKKDAKRVRAFFKSQGLLEE